MPVSRPVKTMSPSSSNTILANFHVYAYINAITVINLF